MKILNVHGYNGSQKNSAAVALEKLGYNVISPSINYDSDSPESIIDNLSAVLYDESPDVVVGTSLGGFFAAVLSARNDLPVILVNPCLMPFLTLEKLGYKGNVMNFVPLFWKLSELKLYNTNTIVGGQDEIIDHNAVTKKFLDNERYKEEPEGKHSGATLPLEEFFSETIEHIKNTKEYNAEKAVDTFCSCVNKQLVQRLKSGDLLKSGNKLTWVNLNGKHNITVNKYDKEKAIVTYTVEGEDEKRQSQLDKFYILDIEHLSSLYDKAGSFNDKNDAPDVRGVYILWNTKEDKYYVGQAKNIRSRMCDHYHKSSQSKFDRLFRSENNNFSKKYIPLESSGFSDLDALETAFIAYFDSYNKVYNERRGNKLLLDRLKVADFLI
ncbi:MAG: GIY-YIG nuclease family protein [Clostridia bacterium]|nr:GIY-YIG nuclease family protein [Clostridia bacterium]